MRPLERRPEDHCEPVLLGARSPKRSLAWALSIPALGAVEEEAEAADEEEKALGREAEVGRGALPVPLFALSLLLLKSLPLSLSRAKAK